MENFRIFCAHRRKRQRLKYDVVESSRWIFFSRIFARCKENRAKDCNVSFEPNINRGYCLIDYEMSQPPDDKFLLAKKIHTRRRSVYEIIENSINQWNYQIRQIVIVPSINLNPNIEIPIRQMCLRWIIKTSVNIYKTTTIEPTAFFFEINYPSGVFIH